MWRAEVVAMQDSSDAPPADAAYLLRLEGARPLTLALVLACGPFAAFGGVQLVRALLGSGSGVYGWLALTLFPLLCIAPGVAIVRRSDREQRRAVPGGVILAVEETGLYLGEAPARRIPWTAIAELVVFRQAISDAANAPALVVVPRKSGLASVPVKRRPHDPHEWGIAVDLHLREPKLRKLTTAVHQYAPEINIWDVGLI
ncbi:hypothetical protein [Actinomadura welshii]|uniref:hypothetical protein n=1 Tax=Actinomadura welshii TaxID=3103817 RepID=UPI0012685B89|nr:hypothetical protein [Actinomadura madurae]